jgi:hypothetical protein
MVRSKQTQSSGMQLRRQWHCKSQSFYGIVRSPSCELLPCGRYRHIRPHCTECGLWYWLVGFAGFAGLAFHHREREPEQQLQVSSRNRACYRRALLTGRFLDAWNQRCRWSIVVGVIGLFLDTDVDKVLLRFAKASYWDSYLPIRQFF